MPVIVHDEGITFSSKFDFELLLWGGDPNLTVTEIDAELGADRRHELSGTRCPATG